MPLGSSYLELVYVADPDVAARDAFGRRVAAAVRAGGGAYAWCVAPADFGATVGRLGLSPSHGSRRRPDGTVLAWRTAGLEVALADPSRPFFIDWQVPPEAHPGASPASHLVRPVGITSLRLRGDAGAVRAWLGDEDVPIAIEPGPPAIVELRIGTAAGPITLETSGLA